MRCARFMSAHATCKRIAQRGRRIEPRLSGEALRKRWQISVRKVKLNSFDPVHRKENDRGGERLAIFHHHDEVLKRCKFNAAHAESFLCQRKNHAPEFIPGITQRYNHNRSRPERTADRHLSVGTVIIPLRAFRHELIVAAAEGSLQLARAVQAARRMNKST